ncbi:hypothetical protein [Candidatus Poriferisodalis sp.]|uniref:hypothetical protein n=1 Tax=Candidatus Poriferisodalis sp. TaxID=3101277 RepID=UPI003B02A7D7
MSEQDRARLYAWLREHAGESEAEYLMSCLAPAPLSDLVTKDYLDATLDAKLDAKLSNYVTKDYLDATLDAKLDAKLSNYVTKDYLDAALSKYVTKDYFDAQRNADREEAAQRHKVLIGAIIAMGAALIAAMFGVAAIA